MIFLVVCSVCVGGWLDILPGQACTEGAVLWGPSFVGREPSKIGRFASPPRCLRSPGLLETVKTGAQAHQV